MENKTDAPASKSATGGMTNQMLIDIQHNIESKVSPENKQRYNKTVLAAETLMFDPKTHQNMELVKNPDSQQNLVETVSKGVSGLMWLLYQQSKKSLPAEVLVFAGTTTICKVLDFAERGLKLPVTPEIISQTTKRTTDKLFEQMGITPEQLKAAIAQGKQEIEDYQTHQEYVGNKMQAVKSKGTAPNKPVKRGK
jgi:hypothetical protein